VEGPALRSLGNPARREGANSGREPTTVSDPLEDGMTMFAAWRLSSGEAFFYVNRNGSRLRKCQRIERM